MSFEQLLSTDPRPDDVPEGWIVCQAPRPLWGNKDCESIWHRVAVNPVDTDAREMLEWNCDQKAFILKFVGDDELAPLVASERADNAETFARFDTTDAEILADIKARLYQFTTKISVDELLGVLT